MRRCHFPQSLGSAASLAFVRAAATEHGMMGKTASAIDRHVAQRLALAMQLAGMSSADLAAALAVDDATVARWLAGQQRIGADALCEVVQILHQPVAFFFLGDKVGDAAAAASQSAPTASEGESVTRH